MAWATHAEVVPLAAAVPDALPTYAYSKHVQQQRFLVPCILQSHEAYDHASTIIIEVPSRGKGMARAGSCLLGNSDDCREVNYSRSANHVVAIKTQANVRGSGGADFGERN